MRNIDAVILVNESLLAYPEPRARRLYRQRPTGNGKSCSGLPVAGEPEPTRNKTRTTSGQQFLALVINNDHIAMQTPDQGSSTSALRHSMQRKQRGPAMHAGSSFKPCQSNPHRISHLHLHLRLSSAQLIMQNSDMTRLNMRLGKCSSPVVPVRSLVFLFFHFSDY